jgi:hypothetical protein
MIKYELLQSIFKKWDFWEGKDINPLLAQGTYLIGTSLPPNTALGSFLVMDLSGLFCKG